MSSRLTEDQQTQLKDWLKNQFSDARVDLLGLGYIDCPAEYHDYDDIKTKCELTNPPFLIKIHSIVINYGKIINIPPNLICNRVTIDCSEAVELQLYDKNPTDKELNDKLQYSVFIYNCGPTFTITSHNNINIRSVFIYKANITLNLNVSCLNLHIIEAEININSLKVIKNLFLNLNKFGIINLCNPEDILYLNLNIFNKNSTDYLTSLSPLLDIIDPDHVTIIFHQHQQFIDDRFFYYAEEFELITLRNKLEIYIKVPFNKASIKKYIANIASCQTYRYVLEETLNLMFENFSNIYLYDIILLLIENHISGLDWEKFIKIYVDNIVKSKKLELFKIFENQHIKFIPPAIAKTLDLF